MSLGNPRADNLVAAVAARYDRLVVTAARPLHGAINESYCLTGHDGDTFVLKIYRSGWRTLEDVVAEVAAVRFLVDNGVNAPAPVADRDGNLAGRIHTSDGERCFALSRAVPGEVPRLEPESARLFGRAAGTLHKAGADMTASSRPALGLDQLLREPLRTLVHALGGRVADLQYLHRLSDRLYGRLAPIASELTWGFCHGDLHGGNALRSGDAVWPIEFEFCGFGFLAYDVAVYRWILEIHAADSAPTLWRHFCAGYADVHTLTALDLDAVAPFVLARHLWDLAIEARLAAVGSSGVFVRNELDRYLAHFRVFEALLK